MALTLHKQNHIEAWQISGLSQRANCRQHGLNAKTFGNWLRIYRDQQQGDSGIPTMIPVEIKSTVSSTDALWVRSPRGYALELPMDVSPQWLGELLKCLD